MKPCEAEIPSGSCRTLGATLARVGDKWSMLIIWSLEDRSRRFNELRRAIGVSQKVLTSALRGLERDGFLVRTVTLTVPPRVDYALTDMGREVLGPVRTLARWALAQNDRIESARKRFDESACKSRVDGAVP